MAATAVFRRAERSYKALVIGSGRPGMQAPLSLFRDWHDFYLLAGTASATLAGLMFVAASIGSSIFSEEQRAATSAFLTPTVVHFAAVLLASLVVTIPTQSWTMLGSLVGAGGLAGLVYCGRLIVHLIIRHGFNVDLSDRLFYAVIPFLGYLLALIAAVLLLMRSAASGDVLAAAVLTLLVAGIRNAWDMMVWIMIRVPTSKRP
jgi:hypothetical protein